MIKQTFSKILKRKFILLSSIFVVIFSIMWVYKFKPYFLELAKNEVNHYISQQNNLKIDFNSIDLSILKLQASITQLKVESHQQDFAIKIPSIYLQIDPFSLLVGSLSISSFNIDNSEVFLSDKLFESDPNSPPFKLNLEPVFEILPKIPIQKIKIRNNLTTINSPTLSSKLVINTRYTEIINNKNTLSLKLEESNAKLNYNHFESELILNSEINLSSQILKFSHLEGKVGKSKIKFSGEFNHLSTFIEQPEIKAQIDSLVYFEEIKPFVFHFLKKTNRLPTILGSLSVNGYLNTKNLNSNTGDFKIQTENLSYDYLKFGNASINLKIKDNNLSFDKISLKHPAANINLVNFEINQQKPFQINSQVEFNDFELQKLFSSLNLKDIPANFKANGIGKCSGQIIDFQISCSTKIIATHILVKPAVNSKNTIVDLEKILINGDVKFDEQKFTFKNTGQINNSTFFGEGDVDYLNGFNMKFKTENLVLNDIKNIADLNLKGIIKGELSTKGNSHKGIITSHIDAKDFEIDKFQLGNVLTQLTYENGNLSLNDTQVSIENSKMNGHLNLNFSDSHLDGAFDIQKIYGRNLINILNKRFYLPFDLSGDGHGTIDFSGPLNFWKLKYEGQLILNNGYIANENFNQISLHLISDGNKIKFENAKMNKGFGFLNFEGQILTDKKEPYFDLKFKTFQIKAEDVNHLTSIFPKLTGSFNANGTVSESLSQISIKSQFTLKDIFLENQSLPPSQADLELNLDFFNLKGQFLGRQIQLAAQIPFNHKYDAYLKTQLRDFNSLLLLPLIQLPLTNNEYYSSLNADIILKGSDFNLNSMSGSIDLKSFLIQRNTHILRLKQPASITFKSGFHHIDNFNLENSENYIQINQGAFSKIINIKADFNLKLFQFLVPFLDSFSGQLILNGGVNLNSEKLNLLGDGTLKNGFLQLKGFPYPIRDVETKLQFSQSKIFINNITSSLNQNLISGFGQINFISSRHIDVNIQTETSKIDLEFPPQFQTSGLIKTKISGNWLPYTLKIDYVIEQGLITKDFSENSNKQALSIQPSRYLPIQELQQQSPSLLLDINTKFSRGIIIKNPIIEGTAIGELNITGSPESPVIAGKVELTPNSKLYFKDKAFDIQAGHVYFNQNGDRPSRVINPDIYINANARISDYDINLLVQGLANNLIIKPSAQPPLAENDIITLLALGYISDKQGSQVSSDTQQKQTGLEVISALSNQSKLNKKIQEKLGLNVSITPSIDSTKNIAVPKMLVSKKLGKKINASYARPLSGNQQSNEVKVQWLFLPNFSLNLNYLTNTNETELDTTQNNSQDSGQYGLDIEYKKEFK